MNYLAILISAIVAIESNGDPTARGDDNLAYGILQIHSAYAQDASEYAKQNWTHEDAFNPTIANKMFVTYMARYATEKRLGRNPTAEDIARIHNGGLYGYKRSATDPYWTKVKAELIRRGADDLANGRIAFDFSTPLEYN